MGSIFLGILFIVLGALIIYLLILGVTWALSKAAIVIPKNIVGVIWAILLILLIWWVAVNYWVGANTGINLSPHRG